MGFRMFLQLLWIVAVDKLTPPSWRKAGTMVLDYDRQQVRVEPE
jgi:hypothetical protein